MWLQISLKKAINGIISQHVAELPLHHRDRASSLVDGLVNVLKSGVALD
jgi:hypothetical protein